jgi:hypothetical protein
MDTHYATLYDQVPDVDCKGLCVEACGPIDMHPYERARIRRAGVRIPSPADALRQIVSTGDYTCPALQEGRCQVYEVRPMICRVWGASDELPCPHGCRPASGRLTGPQTRRLVDASKQLFTCPKCSRTSAHPADVAEGYCGACHDWTGTTTARTTADQEH